MKDKDTILLEEAYSSIRTGNDSKILNLLLANQVTSAMVNTDDYETYEKYNSVYYTYIRNNFWPRIADVLSKKYNISPNEIINTMEEVYQDGEFTVGDAIDDFETSGTPILDYKREFEAVKGVISNLR